MTLLSKLLAIACSIGFFAAIFFVIFVQITVPKLRKNPDVKDKLGFEYVSGWDIINVAQSLSIPRKLAKKLEGGPLSGLYSKSDLLYKHTNRFDRVLACVFYWLLTSSGIMMISLALMDTFGFFGS
jgi:hypothetical protein